MPLRQTTDFVESRLRLASLDWKVPDFITLCRRQKTLSVAIPYSGGSGSLHLLIDATGIKAESEGEWNARKLGGSRKRLWRKLHLGMDEETLKPAPSRSRQATSATPLFCPTCWARSRPTRRLPQSPLTGPRTRADVTM